MKKIMMQLAFVSGSFITPVIAQTTLNVEKEKNKIEVTGSSELEITPDELYFNVSIREYYGDEKNQKDKVIISTLEQQLTKAVADAGLSKDNLSITGVSGAQNYVDKKKKPTTFLESKQYELKVDSPEKLDVILSKIDNRGLQHAYISRVDHSNKEELKKEVKIKALKAAKDKATYLLAAIGNKIGTPIDIKELEENSYYPAPMYKSNARMMNAAVAEDGVSDSSVEFKKIKIVYKMQAVFEIKY